MRMRKKPWARPELEACKFFIQNPSEYKGRWKEFFGNDKPIYMELGCGKGIFISTLASNHKENNYIAVDMIEAMLGLSKRNIENAYNYEYPENLLLIRANIEQISNVFSSEDEISRIYINFCNPWPKKKHNKKRLTHIRQLVQYKEFLSKTGEIYFKTDSDELFEASLEYFEEAGFKITSKTYDLHENPIFEENIITEHEKMFSEEGIKIKALIAKIN